MSLLPSLQIRILHLLVLIFWASFVLSFTVPQSTKVAAAVISGCLASLLGTMTFFAWLKYLATLRRQFDDRSSFAASVVAVTHWSNLFFWGVILLSAICCVGFTKVCLTESPDSIAWTMFSGIIIGTYFCVQPKKKSQQH